MADEEDDSQKTEDPSGRKLGKAREKGQVASSTEVKSWIILLGGTLMMTVLTPWMMTGVTNLSMPFIEQSHAMAVDVNSLDHMMVDVLLELGIYTAPFMGGLLMLSLFGSIAQTGLLYAPSKIMPELKKISPMAGLKRMFSLRAVVEFLKGILKIGVLGAVCVTMTLPLFDDVAVMPDFSIAAAMDRLFVVAITLSAGAMIVMTVVAAADFAYQKFDFMKSMRMSRQELKDEYKETEGDPQIKARIRKLRAERAQKRMMANVPKADVVITNPTHYAVALEYKMENMQAPKLVAKGVDELAFRIREVAKEHDVPIVENPPLARALYASVELDEEIPVEHYQAVAEVIGYVMKLKEKGRRGPNTIH